MQCSLKKKDEKENPKHDIPHIQRWQHDQVRYLEKK